MVVEFEVLPDPRVLQVMADILHVDDLERQMESLLVRRSAVLHVVTHAAAVAAMEHDDVGEVGLAARHALV